MGNGISKLSFLSNKKTNLDDEPINYKINDLRQQDVDLHKGCISPHIGKSGLAFYAPLGNESAARDKRNRSFELKSKSAGDLASRAKEREIKAESIVEQNLQEKVRRARLTDAKRLLVLRRRQEKEEELKTKYEDKIKKMEERKQEVQNRLRPLHSKVRSWNKDKSSVTNSSLQVK